jgi:bacterial/archaeal transporter family-2 protein
MELGSPWWAGFISYLFGTVGMLAVAITSVEPWLSETVTAPSEYRDG